ncbi:Tetratricopeptide-like helical [Chaetomium sp. MPI-SDFR-AT-0129]|nr:Tetratricopeptide-like helical [Chaetomium sp. MPI-SDFR-AT-0129]
MLPHVRLTRVFDRADVSAEIDRVLGLSLATRESSFRSVALYGSTGVGKSSVALSHMEARWKDNTYDICLWAQGGKTASLKQSFTDIALRLNLPSTQQQTPDDNLILVQDWLQNTGRSWLLVYDNVESYETIMPYWPTSNKGKVIITTRNHSLAIEPALEGVQIAPWDAVTGSQFLMWLLKGNIGRDLEADNDSALILSERLSGHALAIRHMAGLIHRSKFSIGDFTAKYLRDPRALHQQAELEFLFKSSFQSLDEESRSLLGVMSYLMPDEIHQDIFTVQDNHQLPTELSFCADDFTFPDVLARLVEVSLVNQDLNTKKLSTHRLIQTQFRYFSTLEQRQRNFNNAVALIANVFPHKNTLNAQMYEAWQACLIISFEMANDRGRYLLESFSLEDLEVTCNVNMIAVELLHSSTEQEDLRGTILSHQAQIAERLGEGGKAVGLNKEYCSATRPATSATAAMEWFDKSLEWWGSEPGLPPQILMNRARCLIYLEKYREASKLLDAFFSEVGEAKSVNWAVLAYGYFVQAVLHKRQQEHEVAERYFIEARRAWLKGDQGRNHPFNGGCMFNMGVSCLGQGKIEAAIQHIRDSMKITKFHEKKMPAEHARGLFNLSEALMQDNHPGIAEEAIALREEAEAVLKRRNVNITDFSTDDTYDRLISISWR